MSAQNPNKKIFNHQEIEKKWQNYWEQNQINKTPDQVEGKKNYYTLVEFPYPSGNLHVGHWYAFAVTDIYARFKRMQGYNVLYPIGFDAFGLPAENAAIKHGVNPRDWTEQNIAHMSKQLRSMGAMFDWSRMVKTIDPDYYKWTQWMFIQFMKAGLAEQKMEPVNWCPSCKTVLANEQVINGKCERCSSEVEKRDLKQWTLKITKYADRLIDDLDKLDWPEEIKEAQRQWIGRSYGALIEFPVKDREEQIKVFTTRPDTIFGATYMVLAPEHELVQKWLDEDAIKNKKEVENYIRYAKNKSEIERTNDESKKSGVELEGIKAINPAREKAGMDDVEIPIFIADYVLPHYGTGAIMAVPAHDKRDFDFAQLVNRNQFSSLSKSEQNEYKKNAGYLSPDLHEYYTMVDIVHVIKPTRNEITGNTYSQIKPQGVALTVPENITSEQLFELQRKKAEYYLYEYDESKYCYLGTGRLINSGPFDGLDNEEAKQKIVNWLAGKDEMPEFQNEPMKEGVPTEERDNVSVILYDPEADKYAFLKWADEIGWKTPIGGGIKDGESLIEAAKREIKEESGYTDIEFISFTTDHITKGYAKHKNVNRIAYWFGLYFELKSKEQEAISESEKQKHELVWLSEDEVQDFLNTEGSKYHWEQFLKLKKEGKLNKKYHPYARMTKTYRLRDWVVSRQRYWGVPIPVVHCSQCGAVPEKEENLPVLLPEVEDYLPSDDGRSPLAKVEEFVNTTCPVCGAPAKRETDTLDTFVDSSWYFLRYIDPRNEREFSSKQSQELWMPVDFYSGGAEHTTMHLLYSRFWQKALYDLGLVKDSEPYKRRLNRGIILGPDGNKMSKSKGNVIDPDKVVEQVGSDTVRGYLAFIGPYNEPGHYPWNPDGVVSIRRFLERVYGLQFSLADTQNEEVEKLLHKTIKKAREDSEKLKFNTAISAMMVFVREADKKGITKEQFKTFVKLIAPFAPHLSEELWQEVLGESESVHLQSYPEPDPEKVKEDVVKVAVQINGKVRAEIELAPDATEKEAKQVALSNEKVQKHLQGKEIKKFIYVPGRIINIVL